MTSDHNILLDRCHGLELELRGDTPQINIEKQQSSTVVQASKKPNVIENRNAENGEVTVSKKITQEEFEAEKHKVIVLQKQLDDILAEKTELAKRFKLDFEKDKEYVFDKAEIRAVYAALEDEKRKVLKLERQLVKLSEEVKPHKKVNELETTEHQKLEKEFEEVKKELEEERRKILIMEEKVERDTEETHLVNQEASEIMSEKIKEIQVEKENLLKEKEVELQNSTQEKERNKVLESDLSKIVLTLEKEKADRIELQNRLEEMAQLSEAHRDMIQYMDKESSKINALEAELKATIASENNAKEQRERITLDLSDEKQKVFKMTEELRKYNAEHHRLLKDLELEKGRILALEEEIDDLKATVAAERLSVKDYKKQVRTEYDICFAVTQ